MQFLNFLPPKCTKWTRPSSEAVIVTATLLPPSFMPLSAWSPVSQHWPNIATKKKPLIPDFNIQGRLTVFLSHDWWEESCVIQASPAVSMIHRWPSLELAEFSISPFNLGWKCCLETTIPGIHTTRRCKKKTKNEKQTNKLENPIRLTR